MTMVWTRSRRWVLLLERLRHTHAPTHRAYNVSRSPDTRGRLTQVEDEEDDAQAGVSPRTGHPAWLLLPPKTLKRVAGGGPIGLEAVTAATPAAKLDAAAASARGRRRRGGATVARVDTLAARKEKRQEARRKLLLLEGGYWDERHRALTMRLKAPPTPEPIQGDAPCGAKISGPYRRWLAAQAKERTVADSRVLPTAATGRRSPARKAAVPLPVVPIRRCDST